MKWRRAALTIAAATAGFALLGCVVFSNSRSGPEIRVQYGEALADKKDVRYIRQVVLHERWNALYQALRHCDNRCFRRSVRQLAFGRLRRITGTSYKGAPAVAAYYENTIDRRYSAEYTLLYNHNRWKFVGWKYYDATFTGDSSCDLKAEGLAKDCLVFP
ncbi:MAG TPA: hypothetical protein VL361_25220 [Candidatus Limnocylindrales bacterium]|nr:hypothetical protein [Candidatus Limnocylindrales bacterium]